MTTLTLPAESELLDLIFPRFEVEPQGVSLDAKVLLPAQTSGKIVSDNDSIRRATGKVVWFGNDPSPTIFDNPENVAGIVATRLASHYKIVASAEGIPIALVKPEQMDTISRQYSSGLDNLSIDGITGKVYLGGINIAYPDLEAAELARIVAELSSRASIQVRVNADTPSQARKGRLFGAQGTGPVRTEYMFFQEQRLRLFRKLLLGVADTRETAELQEYQKKDYEEIFTALEGLPVCIRLLDPPIDEFFPNARDINADFANELGVNLERLVPYIESIQQRNPMLGWRGSRIGITNPEIYAMQVDAAISALAACRKKGIDAQLEILVPLVMNGKEMKIQADAIQETAGKTLDRLEYRGNRDNLFTIGAMIEVPEACYDAADIARSSKTFSFGTNDLTQAGLGLSREDASFIQTYLKRGIFERDPFQVISDNAVGRMMTMAVREGKKVNPRLCTGVCGEQASDMDSIRYLLRQGSIDYIAVSPFKVLTTLYRVAQQEDRGDAL